MVSRFRNVLDYLGAGYSSRCIDGEDCIFRRLSNGVEFEVSGAATGRHMSLYVWRTEGRQQLIGVYHGIASAEALKDILGYAAVRYQNLMAQIQVEREEPLQ